MEVTQVTVDFIKGFEGCILDAYQDQRGIWTIGYGSTGQGIEEGTSWTQYEAEEDLSKKLNGIAHWLDSLVKVGTTPGQNTALISLCYNIGYGEFKKSALLRLLNESQYQAAADQFLLWDKINGYVSNGLLRRRHAERSLFLQTGILPPG